MKTFKKGCGRQVSHGGYCGSYMLCNCCSLGYELEVRFGKQDKVLREIEKLACYGDLEDKTGNIPNVLLDIIDKIKEFRNGG